MFLSVLHITCISLKYLQVFVNYLKPTKQCNSFKFNVKYCIEIYWRQSSVDDNCVYVIDAVNYF